MFKVGIVGIGMVGAQLRRYFEEVKKYRRGRNLFLYDIDPRKKYSDDITRADVVFLCLPTPQRKEDGACDTSFIEAAIRTLTGEKLVVIKSTVPPGTTEAMGKKFPQHMFFFSPEFLTESRAWEDMVRPDRQVVGHTALTDAHASSVLTLLPEAFFSSPGTLGTYTYIRVNATEAEMGKYAGNAFGAFKVTFGNVLADFCRCLEGYLKKKGIETPIEYDHVRSLVAHDRRIGDAWLDIGHGAYRGFGGYCFPKDVSALIALGRTVLAGMPERSKHRPVFAKAIQFLEAMWDYNKTLLASQGLTIDDVSVHDAEWVRRNITHKR